MFDLIRPLKTLIDIMTLAPLFSPEDSAPALLGVEGTRCSYGDLAQSIAQFVNRARDLGVRPDDCLAMVIPDGVSAAAGFLVLASSCACAPLNPAYSIDDFQFYLEDLQPCALVLPEGYETPAIEAAAKLGIPLWRVRLPGPGQPEFALLEADRLGTKADEVTEPSHTALILHTSGTTSRPKIVPLSHANLLESAANVARTLQLTPTDCCLNVMPLFHIHGLVGGLLSSIKAGASVLCAKFSADDFLSWAIGHEATWYTAVPTIHQAILAQAEAQPELAEKIHFRLIRSSSSALPPPVFDAMEARWQTPVIESYGMTEAAHQMASNLLPPGQRKAGSVGMAAGPEVAIMNDVGELLPRGEHGEIVIRGDNVTTGYRSNPEANAKAFTNGWFRTGDQGRFDGDGYLFLDGRLKEMINRGGENIAPKEIDDALLRHPEVAQAVAFAAPHPTLGEDIIAAVVLRPDAAVTTDELRDALVEKMTPFKVPSRIIAIDAIPKGPTGKIQRIGLFEKLRDALAVTFRAPETELEQRICGLFAELLGEARIGLDDNFFFLGGDSLKAQRLMARIGQAEGIELEPGTVFRNPTPAQLVAIVEQQLTDNAEIDTLASELQDLSPEELQRLLSGQ